jgi:hypothetical protein
MKKNPIHELVHVRNAHVLVDSAWRVRSYTTRNGRPLQPGYYLTLRPGQSGDYDRRTRYYGPFESRHTVGQLAVSARYLGLAEPAPAQIASEGGTVTPLRRPWPSPRSGDGDEAWRNDHVAGAGSRF